MLRRMREGDDTNQSRRREPARLKSDARERIAELQYSLARIDVTDEGFNACRRFLRGCLIVGTQDLPELQRPRACYFVGELLAQAANAAVLLAQQGDIWMARDLSAIRDSLLRIEKRFADKISRRPARRPKSAAQILRNEGVGKVLATLLQRSEAGESLLDAEDRERLQALPRAELRAALRQSYSHSIKVIYNSQRQRTNINFFVELLYQGKLWNGGQFVACPWRGKERNPAKADVQAWIELVRPFLRKHTNDDPRALNVFQYLLARRKFVHAGAKLADDKREYAWNQIEKEIRRSWKTMSTRGIRRSLTRPVRLFSARIG